MIKEILLIIFSIMTIILILTLAYIYAPALFMESNAIYVSQDPIQIPYGSSEPIIKTINGVEYKITPVAKYQISAMVGSKCYYSSGVPDDAIPVDLVLVWGKITEPEYYSHFSFWQSDRKGFYRYDSTVDLGSYYIITHFSNNHIIPANENVRRGIDNIRENQVVTLEGYLVNLVADQGGMHFYFDTSTRRDDTYANSCEVIYVEKVIIGDNVYE